jgi:hypothetical protein
MRLATGATATLLSIAVVAGAAEVGMHGFKFFVFRGGGVGQTAGTETDQQFLARQAQQARRAAAAEQAAARQTAAPRGRHHKTSHQH